jgi:hypothetical protein
MGNFNQNYVLYSIIRRVSSGAAFSILLDYEPDKIVLNNYTQFGTAGELVSNTWFRGMPDASSLSLVSVVDSGVSGDGSTELVVANGFTISKIEGGVATTRRVITGISQADPAVVTAVAHGFPDEGRVRITNVVGMSEINLASSNPYKIKVLTADTFSLQDLDGNDIDSTGFGAYVSGGSVNLVGSPDRMHVFYEPDRWQVTFGTAIAGADNDVLFIEAYKAGEYIDQGKP